MKKVFVLLTVLTVLFTTSCTDAFVEREFTNYCNEFKIEMYSGGSLVRSWISTGKVSSKQNSNNYYFKDKVTGKLVEVTGDIVITNNED